MPTTYVNVEAREFYRGFNTDSRIGYPVITAGSSNIRVSTDCTSRVENPNWRVQIAQGSDASTEYLKRKLFILQSSIGSASAFKPPTVSNDYRIDTESRFCFIGAVNPQYTTDTATYQIALARFKQRLQSRMGRGNFAAPLAEVRELHGLIKQTLMLSGDFLTALLRAKRTRGGSLRKFFSETWLGYSFAMSPLLNDIGGLGQSIAEYLAREDFNERFAASATTTGHYTYVPSTSISQAAFASSEMKTADASYTLSYKFIGAAGCSMRSGNDYSLLGHFGLTFDQLPATLYELTAFSWMADYFTNIGDYLSDVFAGDPVATKYLVCCRKYVLDYVHTYAEYWDKANPNGLIQTASNPSICIGKYIEFERTPLPQLPKASLYIKTSAQIGNWSPAKLLNLLSLLSK